MTCLPRAALFAVLGLIPVGPYGATQAQPSTVAEGPTGMTVPQFQGLSCLGGGGLGALVAYAYTDTLVLAGAVTINPLVFLGLAMATSFAVGCSIAANAAPGVFWLSTRYR